MNCVFSRYGAGNGEIVEFEQRGSIINVFNGIEVCPDLFPQVELAVKINPFPG